jgi:hypothetical membrane protein
MIGALYIVLLGVCATLYVESQSKQREVYIWRLSITSMAAIGLMTWWSDNWKLYCFGGVAIAALMVFANHGWPKQGFNDESWGTWTGRSALCAVLIAIGAYVLLVLMIASPESTAKKEWPVVWAVIIVACLLLTYTKRGAWLWSEMVKHNSLMR